MPKSNLLWILIIALQISNAQNIELYTQFNGRYDYVAIGNTMNILENGPSNECDILTSSSAELNLNNNEEITAAYLYWAGSGEGEFDVALNGIPISAERTFSDALDDTRVFFAAFADVTDILLAQGNGNYTLSELDLTDIIGPFCPTGTNFAGWAITIIFEDDNLPLNQLNVYDGLQSVPSELTIVLDNLNVLDNEDAKIGFVAWEGDAALAVNETLTINGNVISNPPLNPANNAFNGTNSFNNTSGLHNMDIDVYNIQDNIDIGDTLATIQLTSGQDFVMINNIITVLNSQLPDASITLSDVIVECDQEHFELDYIVFNNNSTDILPQNTPIAFYLDNILVAQTATVTDIEIGGSENNTVLISIPEELSEEIQITAVVDDDGSGLGIITEINEDNNTANQLLQQISSAPIIDLGVLEGCDLGFDQAIFNLNDILEEVSIEFDTSNASYFENEEDAQLNENEISNITEFQNNFNPQVIFVGVENVPCYQLFKFSLEVANCPPIVPQGFSPNDDGFNDWFNIQGLYDVFQQHELLIYNRYGTLIFEGNNNLKWFGKTNKGINANGILVPVGTYFYVLHLNDPQFQPITGWVYVIY